MGGTLNSCRAMSSCVVSGRRREVRCPDLDQGVLPQNWGEAELNRSVTCMVLCKVCMVTCMANDRRHLGLRHDEFRGP
ncbi:hypothetical protein TNCV_4478421 [Trichonephila clavipes]|nr:hypothetical protein TNCV_4478421 [Trichonephila clavipes]